MRKLTLGLVVILLAGKLYAHEPLYGFGPHVLFRGGFAPHINLLFNQDTYQTEYALGYGITKTWTLSAEVPYQGTDSEYLRRGFVLKSKNRLWLNTKPGKSFQGSIVSRVELPAQDDQPTTMQLAMTVGQEALKFYWFASAGYVARFTDNELEPGNNVLYNFSIGYRPFKVDYYKPDLVLFIETTGNAFQKSRMNGELMGQSGGTNLAIAPTMFLTYKNLAIRGGMQFGLSNSAYAPKIKRNVRVTIELHI